MKRFSDFGIKTTDAGFTGEKIKIKKVFNKEITIKKYKIEPSKFQDRGNGKCLHLQIEMDGSEHLIFSGSSKLMEQIELVNKDDFPFKATIVNNDDKFEFV